MINGNANERDARVIALLEDNIRTELSVTNGMLDLGLDEVAIERLMEGVSSGLLYVFAVNWSPDWVKPGDLHGWEEHGDQYSRCPVCLIDSPARGSRAEAETWVLRHSTEH